MMAKLKMQDLIHKVKQENGKFKNQLGKQLFLWYMGIIQNEKSYAHMAPKEIVLLILVVSGITFLTFSSLF